MIKQALKAKGQGAMKRFSGRLMVILVFALTVSGCSRAGLDVGERLPNLVFYDPDGNKVRIYQYVEPGKKLLIHFWGAACCLTYSIPTIQAVSSIHKSGRVMDVNVVSVNLDYATPKVRGIVRELGIDHPMLIDKDASYYRADPKLRLFFPLALILVVNDKKIVQARITGPQLLPSIQEALEQARY